MAKSSAPAPARSRGYDKILVCTLAAMIGGIVLLVMEWGEYDFKSEAKADPPVKITPLPAPEPGGAKPPAPAPPPGM